jgi:CO/xanthine dehydrogenase Mo-binding subunit
MKEQSQAGNAVLDAVGVNMAENPITPEKGWRTIVGRN